MTTDDKIAQAIYDSLDRQAVLDHRRRAIEFAVCARRARRAGDMGAVLFNYNLVMDELMLSSDDKAHQAMPILLDECKRLEYGNA